MRFSRVGVSRPDVGVVDRPASFSGDFSGDFSSDLSGDFSGDLAPSVKKSLLPSGVDGRICFSGDMGEDPYGDPPSIKLLRSLTLPPVCRDCMRLCAAPLMRDLSGEPSIRFGEGFVI